MIMRMVRNQPRTTREDLVNDLYEAGSIVTKKTIGNTLRHEGLKSCSTRPPTQGSTCTAQQKFANVSQDNWVKVLWTQLAVFGGGGMLPMFCCGERTTALHQWDDGWGQVLSGPGHWSQPCRALKMGHGWVFQHDNNPKHIHGHSSSQGVAQEEAH